MRLLCDVEDSKKKKRNKRKGAIINISFNIRQKNNSSMNLKNELSC